MAVRVLQRCAVYGLWPQRKLICSEPFQISIGAEAEPMVVRMCVQTYRNRQTYREAANVVPTAIKNAYPTFERTTGFYVGDTFYSEKIGDVAGQLVTYPPYEGDIDVYAEVETERAETAVLDALAPYVSTYLLSLVLNSGDLISPKFSMAIFSHSSRKLTFPHAIHSGGTRARSYVSFANLKKDMQAFYALSGSSTREEMLCVGAAARRIVTARNELDVIDKFCDYWEACEFLCETPEHTATNDKSMRVAKDLAKITGDHHDDLWEVLTKPIYEFRNNVVHEFVSRENDAKPMITLLEDVACKLFARRAGAKTDSSNAVAGYLDQVRAGKLSPMRRKNGPPNYRMKAKASVTKPPDTARE